LPLLESVEGRADDVLYTTDGRRVARLGRVFQDRRAIREAQIIQESLDRVRVRYVPAPGFDGEAARSIEERLRSRLGPVEVTLEAVAEIPREKNGKFRAVVCRIANRHTDPVLSA
jgi:phenylacetate-CoA ligase